MIQIDPWRAHAERTTHLDHHGITNGEPFVGKDEGFVRGVGRWHGDVYRNRSQDGSRLGGLMHVNWAPFSTRGRDCARSHKLQWSCEMAQPERPTGPRVDPSVPASRCEPVLSFRQRPRPRLGCTCRETSRPTRPPVTRQPVNSTTDVSRTLHRSRHPWHPCHVWMRLSTD